MGRRVSSFGVTVSGQCTQKHVDVVGAEPVQTSLYRPAHRAPATSRLQRTRSLRTCDGKLGGDAEFVAAACDEPPDVLLRFTALIARSCVDEGATSVRESLEDERD